MKTKELLYLGKGHAKFRENLTTILCYIVVLTTISKAVMVCIIVVTSSAWANVI